MALDSVSATQMAKRMAANLPDDGKELLLKAAYWIADVKEEEGGHRRASAGHGRQKHAISVL